MSFSEKQPEHGGCLNLAAERYGIPREEWLDLSTGINPNAFQIDGLPQDCFLRLPEEDDGLLEVAHDYYGTEDLILTPGSQWGIQNLPIVYRDHLQSQTENRRVLLPSRGYQEHHFAWKRMGFEVCLYDSLPKRDMLNSCSVCVVINPNNPTGRGYDPSELRHCLEILRANNALLVVDEAFIEASSLPSMIRPGSPANLLVFRSIGKFFGLAGIRVGAVYGDSKWLNVLSQQLGPWPISSPSRYIAKCALSDRSWQRNNLKLLEEQSGQLRQLLLALGGGEPRGSLLFQTVFTERAPDIHHRLCRQGVLVRLLDCQKGLRFGLPPADKKSWKRLENALREAFLN